MKKVFNILRLYMAELQNRRYISTFICFGTIDCDVDFAKFENQICKFHNLAAVFLLSKLHVDTIDFEKPFCA